MRADDLIAGRYRLEEILGTGGMASVWRALDTRLDRLVAIKLLSPRMVGDPENLVRFFSEAQSIARLTHRNVVTVLDFGQSDGSPFLVMEYVDGGTLTDLVGSPMLPERALEIIGQVAAAAGAAHQQSIVHRDIKPGNILLDQMGHPRLADFGIAFTSAGERMTLTGTAIGSPHYLSPEQARGATAVPQSDVYALGVVLYELLTGVKLFDGDNVTAIALAHVEQDPVPPSTHVPDLPPEVDALVMRCLAKDPSARFSDGAALAIAVGDGFDVDATVGFPAHAAADARSQGPGAQRLRRRVLAGICTVALLGAGGAAFGMLGGDTPDESVEAAETDGGQSDEGGDDEAPIPSPTPTSLDQPVSQPAAEEEEQEDEKKKPKRNRSNSGGDGGKSTEEPEEEPEEEPAPSPSPSPEPEPEPSPSASEGDSSGSSISGDSTTEQD